MDTLNVEKELQNVLYRIPENGGKYLDISPGWHPIVAKLNHDIAQIDPKYVVHQVKQKFGGLRYYVEHNPNPDKAAKIRKLIAEAEEQSFKICEKCASPDAAQVTKDYWIQTLCAACTNP